MKKKFKVYKASVGILWTKEDMTDEKGLIHKNGHINKVALKARMAHELTRLMRDITIDKSKPFEFEFDEFEVDEEGYKLL